MRIFAKRPGKDPKPLEMDAIRASIAQLGADLGSLAEATTDPYLIDAQAFVLQAGVSVDKFVKGREVSGD